MTEEEKQIKANKQVKEMMKHWDDSLVVTGGLIDDEGNIIQLSLWSKEIHVSSRNKEKNNGCQKNKEDGEKNEERGKRCR
jgi:hypothetical protein